MTVTVDDHVRQFSPATLPARKGGTATPGHFPSGVLAPRGELSSCRLWLPRGPSHRRALLALGRVYARITRELGA